MKNRLRWLLVGFLWLLLTGRARAGRLTAELQQVPLDSLVSEALAEGNAERGAILFHLERLQCTRCHLTGGLGPVLTDYHTAPTRAHLLEAILSPSKQIRAGYETVVAVTEQGLQITGLLVAEDDRNITLLDSTGTGVRHTFAKRQLEQFTRSTESLMPAGLPDQLSSKSEFLDLARFVIEVAEGGARRADELNLAVVPTQAPPLPAYERHVDHAGLIRALDDEAFERGGRIYRQICSNCHGSPERPGSLPTSPRFSKAIRLKNGADPYRMYQTLTHGYGFMVPQRWMVPRQKYEVIHFIRESFFRRHNPSLYTPVTEAYLEALPKGDTEGPEPVAFEPFRMMDYGPALHGTYEIALNNNGDEFGFNLGHGADPNTPLQDPGPMISPGLAPNFAYKGIAVRLNRGTGGVARGTHWMVYDHDTMSLQAAWEGDQFIDFAGIHFDGQHGVHPRLCGRILLQNPVGPGWAHPIKGNFDDPRPLGRDGRPYGPLPRNWLRYRGLYQCGEEVVLAYRVGEAEIYEQPTMLPGEAPVLVRSLWIGPTSHDLRLRLAEANPSIVVRGGPARLSRESDRQVLEIPAGDAPRTVEVLISELPSAEVIAAPSLADPRTLIAGGPGRWPQRVRTSIERVHEGEFLVDRLRLPQQNPWSARVRPTGFDFFADGATAAVCTWDGDVWLVRGWDQTAGELEWQRIATGLFQPLGLKIVDEAIYVTCRDQLVRLHDLNDDGETDFYECFNNDHQVTEHFHEFAMGLQRDAAGNFYYAKSARHAKHAVVPHHGTLLKVSPGGETTEIVATGFRAANGVCLNADGSFFVTDQEGHWTPKNRINHVVPGGFYGNLYGFTDLRDTSDDAMERPLCWITNRFDRSPAELLWVPKQHWGPLGGALLSLSYGYGKIFVVPHESVRGVRQGGMCALPIPDAASGLIRGRFSPSGDLLVCGMYSWSSHQTEPGVLLRVRYTGKPVHLPVAVRARSDALELTFSHPLEPAAATQPDNYRLTAWDIRRTPEYGSEHYRTRDWTVRSVSLDPSGRTVRLEIPELETTRCYAVRYRLTGREGRVFQGEFHGSIHQIAPDGYD